MDLTKNVKIHEAKMIEPKGEIDKSTNVEEYNTLSQ